MLACVASSPPGRLARGLGLGYTCRQGRTEPGAGTSGNKRNTLIFR